MNSYYGSQFGSLGSYLGSKKRVADEISSLKNIIHKLLNNKPLNEFEEKIVQDLK